MTTAKARKLDKSNAQFKKAVQRLPLGVSSTFRYWGDDRTIYVDHGKGGRVWKISNATVDRVQEAVAKGAAGFIVKPFNAARVVQEIKSLLKK